MARHRADGRRVVVKARIVRHRGLRYRSAPLARHVAYLERDGVTRDGQDAALFDATGDAADRDAFGQRCEGDRHHFRFIVSPEDAGDLGDLRSFTRDLMADMARDLETRLDWVAIDHWNTDNPHVHILVRGRADDGTDLVIDRAYVSQGIRYRAEERMTLELGPRSERELRAALEREVGADRWTSLDRRLLSLAEDGGGIVDLRPGTPVDAEAARLLRGRAARLEELGVASRAGPAQWTIEPRAEEMLREIGERGDIIKTMHRAMARGTSFADPGRFALHGELPGEPVIGRFVERGLDDELAGSAYAIVDGADGRVHHLRFADLDMTGDAAPGAIVELRSWRDGHGRLQSALAVRSDLSLAEQVTARGATWLDRQLLAREPAASGNGFGLEVRTAMASRAEHLEGLGFATREGGRVRFPANMIDALRSDDIAAAARAIAARTGLDHRAVEPGGAISGTYRERVTLASGRFAMIDDGLGFQLVPWRPALDGQLGRPLTGAVAESGGIDWSFGRVRGISI